MANFVSGLTDCNLVKLHNVVFGTNTVTSETRILTQLNTLHQTNYLLLNTQKEIYKMHVDVAG